MLYDKIKKECEEKNISIRVLEKEVGLGNGSISKWKNASPTVDNMKKVSDFFEKPIEYFLKT